MRKFIMPARAILIVAAVLFASSPYIYAQSAKEKTYLSLYFTDEELQVVSATRSLKSISQVAENVSVVTASDIELMNAHTLAEVLNTVTGVTVFAAGIAGPKAQASIQGADETHVIVLMDGVVLNNLSSNIADIGMIPVQNIEKIEIIKGPASSSWGSALGGVVNIITKQGSPGNSGGVLSASYGKSNTDDFRAEARGKEKGLGYYLTAGRLQSDGLTPNMQARENSAYAKLTYDITDYTGILFTLGYEKVFRGDGLSADPNLDFFAFNTTKTVFSTLALNSSLNKEVALNVSVRTSRIESNEPTYAFSSGDLLQEEKSIDKGYGASAKLTWKHSDQEIVLGSDYDSRILELNSIAGGSQGQRKWALYANDTISLNKLSFTPGVRYDHTSTNGSITSPSLGITYSLAENTILRAFTARGFSIPTLFDTFGDSVNFIHNPDLKMETVWTHQAGIETAALKYIWLKMTAFTNNVRDALFQQNLTPSTFTTVNQGRQRRQGLEIEAKTLPVYHTSLFGGAEFIDAKTLDDGKRIGNVPTHVYDLGLRYDDEQSLRALLKGRYINWNASQFDIPDLQGAYGSFVFDLSVTKKIYQHKDASLEAFAGAHNIFNGNQYLVAVFRNPERWFEGGLRYTF
jgi:vitamin B12 transporter